MSVQVQKLWQLTPSCVLVVHIMNTEVKEFVLGHAAVLGSTDRKPAWFFSLQRFFWASVGVGKSHSKAGQDKDGVIRAVDFFVVLKMVLVSHISLMAANDHRRTCSMNTVTGRTKNS